MNRQKLSEQCEERPPEHVTDLWCSELEFTWEAIVEGLSTGSLIPRRTNSELESLRVEAKAELVDLIGSDSLEELSCQGCHMNRYCPYAFDIFNLNGDCLASK